MVQNSVSLDFKLKEINEIRNYYFEEIKHIDLMNGKYKKGCRA